jgi:hypothetical protein
MHALPAPDAMSLVYIRPKLGSVFCSMQAGIPGSLPRMHFTWETDVRGIHKDGE